MLKCTKIDFGWGSAPDPAGGAYSAPPDPLAGFKGPTSKRRGRERRGGEGKGGKGRGGLEAPLCEILNTPLQVRGGGGVMVSVKETVPACDIAMDDVTGEVCWVRIDTKDNPLYVVASYRTPSDRYLHQLEQLDKSLDNIAKLTRNTAGSMTVLAGDFNAGGVDWEAGVTALGTKQSSICQKELNICVSHGVLNVGSSISHSRETL